VSFRPFASRVPVASLLASALLASATLACQGSGVGEGDSLAVRSPGDAAREFAIAVDRQRLQLKARDWKTESSDGSVTLTGYSLGDTLRLVRETQVQGERGRAASRYYFDGAQLRYFESNADVESGAPPRVRKERLVLAFDKGGVAVEISHQLDGATAPVDSVRIAGVVARAAEVARQWATSPATGH
jgi:hypothetical protein